ncbi:unnamed protein product [Pedinophyceae sp. YPF-701]|nr:unnamed protein product [Pedinophyceae sp. YPF-701]
MSGHMSTHSGYGYGHDPVYIMKRRDRGKSRCSNVSVGSSGHAIRRASHSRTSKAPVLLDDAAPRRGSRVKRELQAMGHLALRRPMIVIWSLLATVVTAGLLTTLFILVQSSETDRRKQEAAGRGRIQATYVSQLVQNTLSPAQALALDIRSRPEPNGVVARFTAYAEGMLKQLDDPIYSTVEVAPDTIIAEVYPYDGESEKAIGLDLFNHPNEGARASVRNTIVTGQPTFQGPLKLQGEEGPLGVLVRFPVYVPVGPGTVFNAQGQASASGNRFWDVKDDGEYLWGFAILVLYFENFLDSLDFQPIVDAGYTYRLYDPAQGEAGARFKVSDPAPSGDTITIPVDLPSSQWAIEIGVRDSWVPDWLVAGWVISSTLGLIVGCLVFGMLVSHARHVALLEAMYPRHVLAGLKRGELVAESLPHVATIFADIVGYTAITARMAPRDVLTMLNDLYSQVDSLCEEIGAYKVEIIGDSYIAVVGAQPNSDPVQSAEQAARLALAIMHVVQSMPMNRAGVKLQLRVGLHMGPLVAGIVGASKPKWTLLGDVMNTGSRMESTSEPMKIQMSDAFKQVLDRSTQLFVSEPRTSDGRGIFIKGKGNMVTHWLLREVAPSTVENEMADVPYMRNTPASGEGANRSQPSTTPVVHENEPLGHQEP